VRRYWSPLGSSLKAAPCRRPTSRRDLEPTLPKSCTLSALTLKPVRRCWRPARLDAPIGATSLPLDRSLAIAQELIPCHREFPRPIVRAELYPALGPTWAPCRSNAAKRNLRPLCYPHQPSLSSGRRSDRLNSQSTKLADASTRDSNRACAHPIVAGLAPSRIFGRSALRPSCAAS
jgi:hypothetical protein